MTVQTLQPAKAYAKQICMFLKKMPGKYADDPQDVQDALGLTDAEFKLGVDWCVERGILEMDDADDKESSADQSAGGEKPSDGARAEAPKAASPFTADDEDVTEAVSPFKAAAEKDEDVTEAVSPFSASQVEAIKEEAWA